MWRVSSLWGFVFVMTDNNVENDVCEDGVCIVYIWWWLNVFCVCSELCPVWFPIVSECVSVLV